MLGGGGGGKILATCMRGHYAEEGRGDISYTELQFGRFPCDLEESTCRYIFIES